MTLPGRAPRASGWQETVLYAFTGGNDGSGPIYRLVMDHAGNLYGTTSEGGNLLNCPSHPLGCGGAFKLSRTQTGWTFTPLYDFTDSDSAEARLRRHWFWMPPGICTARAMPDPTV